MDDAQELDYIFYELRCVKVTKPAPREFRIANASVGSCGLCGRVITGMGGSLNMVCLPCGNALMTGQLLGCVIYEETPDGR